MKQQMLERRVTELEGEVALLKQQLKDERSGKAWRDANADRAMERERINS